MDAHWNIISYAVDTAAAGRPADRSGAESGRCNLLLLVNGELKRASQEVLKGAILAHTAYSAYYANSPRLPACAEIIGSKILARRLNWVGRIGLFQEWTAGAWAAM